MRGRLGGPARLFRLVGAVLVALAAACGRPPSAPVPEGAPKRAERLAHEVAARYRAVRTYEAAVEIEGAHRRGEAIERWTSRGTLRTARPLRLRWESESPWRVVAVSDGETLWTHLPDLGLVRAEPAERALRRFGLPPGPRPVPDLALLPLLVLDDPVDYLNVGAVHYEIGGGEGAEGVVEIYYSGEMNYVGAALPGGAAWPALSSRLYAGEDGLVRWVERRLEVESRGRRPPEGETGPVEAPIGLEVRVRETHREIGLDADLPETFFRFAPPPGVRVVAAFDEDALRPTGR